jgi:hypothetical protein
MTRLMGKISMTRLMTKINDKISMTRLNFNDFNDKINFTLSMKEFKMHARLNFTRLML